MTKEKHTEGFQFTSERETHETSAEGLSRENTSVEGFYPPFTIE